MGDVPCEVGAVIYHGDGTKPDATWAATLVRQPGSVVAPIVAGAADAVRAAVEALLPALARPGRAVCDPPVAIVRGLPRMFVAMGGRHLVGVIDTDGRLFALLATDGLGFFVLVHDGARAEVVRAGAPDDLRELDLDPVLDTFAASSRPAAAAKLRQESEPDPPSRTALIRAGLRRLKERCLALARREAEERTKRPRAKSSPPRKRAPTRGRRAVGPLIESLLAAGLTGVGDLIGTTSEIHTWLSVLDPEFRLSLRSLADALRLLMAAAGYFVSRPSPHRWHIHLRELADPAHAVHRRLCEGATRRFSLADEAGSGAPRRLMDL